MLIDLIQLKHNMNDKPWQEEFLEEGTRLMGMDLSCMISAVSKSRCQREDEIIEMIENIDEYNQGLIN